MGMCCTSNLINQKGLINLNDLTKKPPNTINNDINIQNNDDCSILISSSSLEQNYNVKYRESTTLQMFEKTQNANKK